MAVNPIVVRLDGTPFLEIGSGWALAADRNQWVLIKSRNCKGRIKWQPVAYVGSEKTVLVRVMREKGLCVPSDANSAVNRFLGSGPPGFRAWRDEVKGLSDGTREALRAVVSTPSSALPTPFLSQARRSE